MIDEYTRQRLDAVRTRALHDGTNLWDGLDEARLIQTEAEIKKQWAQCLEQLAFNIDAQPLTLFVVQGGGENTPRDAIKGVLEYIDAFKNIFATQAGEKP